MAKLRILNKKEIKKISSFCEKQWSCKIPDEYIYLLSEKDKLYVVDRKFEIIDDSKIRIDKVGMYFGNLSNNILRLSIEGSQILGKKAKRNVVEIDDEARQWMKGEPLEKEGFSGPIIIKNGNDFLGCGIAKKGRILNFVPKERRISP